MKPMLSLLVSAMLLATASAAASEPLDSVPDIRVDALLGDIRWDIRGSGENLYTPDHRPASLLQTAYGQIFYYHRWPVDAIETFSCTTNYETGAEAMTMGGPYDWNSMTPGAVAPEDDEAQAKARGELIWDLGVCLGATYYEAQTVAFLSASSAQDPVRCFHYANARFAGGQALLVTNTLLCSLDAGYPCVVGKNTKCAVVDGYGFKGDDICCHVNFCRGGTGDGWYRYADLFGSEGELYGAQICYNLFPDRTGEIVSGRVFDDAGVPLAGAVVTVRTSNGSFSAESAAVGSNGVWGIAGVPSGATLEVSAFLPGYSFEPHSVQMGTSREMTGVLQWCGNRWGVDLSGVPAASAAVSGTISLPSGKPLAGILVEASGVGSVRTDADGRYAFEIPDGWSGTVAPAAGQGLVSCEPASRPVSNLRAGSSVQCDFTAAAALRVDADAHGSGDGTSWEDAFPSLADALAAAGDGWEVWVAAGTYRPTEGTARAVPFVVPAGVSVYGGFAGTEETRTARDWTANETVLSGEIGDPETKADNSAVLVVGNRDAVLDGFTISGAHLGSGESPAGLGAADERWTGVVCAVHGTDNSSPFDFRVEHCLIRGNTYGNALAKGWALFVSCVFSDNAENPDYFMRRGMFLGCSVQNCSFEKNQAGCFAVAAHSVSNHPYSCLRNNYFGGSSGARFEYSADGSKRPRGECNLHLPKHRVDGSTNLSSLVFASETLSSDPATPAMPPMNSVALDAGTADFGSMTLSGAGLKEGWAAAATDFLGNPRIHGGSIDIGAYEIDPALVRYPPSGIVSFSDVTTNSAVATVTVTTLGTASSASVVLSCRSSNPVGDDRTIDLGVFDAPGSRSVVLSDLGPYTMYGLESVLAGDGTTTTPGVLFRTLATDPPVIRSVRAYATSYKSASVTVYVDTFGVRSNGGAVAVSLYENASFEGEPAASHRVEGMPETPDHPVSILLSGLSPGTTYYVKVSVGSNNGLSAKDTSCSFTTPTEIPPRGTLAFSNVARATAEAVFTISDFGNYSTGVVLHIEFSERSSPYAGAGSIDLDPVSPETLSQSAVLTGLAPGTQYYARGYLKSLPSETVSFPLLHVYFTTESAPSVRWLDVRWTEDGYAPGSDWCVPAAAAVSGGEWIRPDGDSSFLEDGRLALSLPEGGRLRFVASRPSAVPSVVVVEGSLSPVPDEEPPDAAGALAGLAFTQDGFLAWNGSSWIPMSGEVCAAGEDISWKAVLNFASSTPFATFFVDGAALEAKSGYAKGVVTLRGGRALSGIEFAGGGSIGDFRATCSGGFFEPLLAPADGEGGRPLSFGMSADGGPTLDLEIGNAAKYAWYTLYESGTVEGPFTAVLSSQATADGALPLRIDASAPTKFIRIGASDGEVSTGAAMDASSIAAVPADATVPATGSGGGGSSTAVFFR